MEVKLIPVLEIFNYGSNLELPSTSGTSFEYPDEWQVFNHKSNDLAGYSDKLVPYRNGQLYYKLSEVSDKDLTNLLKSEFEEILTEIDKITLENISSLDGGLILNINQQDVLFPQCCASLSDINSWLNLSKGSPDYFYCGHPSPIVTIQDNIVRFEPVAEYQTTPYPHLIVEVDKSLLIIAIEKASQELELFSHRLSNLDIPKEHKIDGFERVLVYGEYTD